MFEMDEEIVTPEYGLYPHQRQVLFDILDKLSSPERRAVAHLPTGAGKTRVACHVCCRLLNDCDSRTSLVIWLAATEELCDQAADELSRAWSHLGFRSARIYRYWGSTTLDLRSLSFGFLITGLAKLYSTCSRDNTVLAHLAHQVAGIVFDEAHQAVARTYSFMTEQLCSTRPPLLGLTATPGRSATPTELDHLLAKMFEFNKVSIDPMGYDNPVTYLINERYLAEPRFIHVDFESDGGIGAPLPDGDYGEDDLENLGRNQERNSKIVELAKYAAARHPRTIVFCPSVDSALECSRYTADHGIVSSVVTAATPTEDRHQIISRFRGDDREHMVLFNYGVLTAGFDAPRTRCVIIARPTTSLVLYSQMAGRAMRGPRAGGNARAEIFTVADTNLPEFGSVTAAFTNWEDIWSMR